MTSVGLAASPTPIIVLHVKQRARGMKLRDRLQIAQPDGVNLMTLYLIVCLASVPVISFCTLYILYNSQHQPVEPQYHIHIPQMFVPQVDPHFQLP